MGEMLLFFVLLGVTVGWHLLNGAAVRGLGEDPAQVVRTPSMTLFQVGAAASLAAAALLPRADLLAVQAFGARLSWMIPILAARLALTVLLGVAVFGLRRRVYATMLRSGLAPLPSPSQRTTLLDISKRAAMVVPPLPIAGDAWWSEVSRRGRRGCPERHRPPPEAKGAVASQQGLV